RVLRNRLPRCCLRPPARRPRLQLAPRMCRGLVHDIKLPFGLLSSGETRPTTGVKTMTVYLIADVKVTDDKWVPSYAASVHDIVHKHGGKYLSRSGNVKTLEGKPLDTTLIALLQFPSAEAAEAFVNDPEYAPHAAARQAGSEGRFQLIDDTDLADNSLSAERMISQSGQIQRASSSRMCGPRCTCMRSKLHRWLRLQRSPRSPHHLPLIS